VYTILIKQQQAVLEAMQEAGALLLKEPYPHKYPYDWRTKKPTIFRATDQWFASVAGFRDAAMAAIDEVFICNVLYIILVQAWLSRTLLRSHRLPLSYS
jgi:isoleucyl-tRNA synthetase